MDTFADWLRNELRLRDWSQSDLSRACNITTATVSRIITGDRKVGKDVAIAIAKALRVPQEVVFQKAGILTSNIDDELTRQVTYYFNTLSEEGKKQALDFLDFLSEKEGKRGNVPNR